MTLMQQISDVRGHESPDSKVHGANMGSTWVLSIPDGPHVDPMNFAIREWALQKQQGMILVLYMLQTLYSVSYKIYNCLNVPVLAK